jgi:hypothetical protein
MQYDYLIQLKRPLHWVRAFRPGLAVASLTLAACLGCLITQAQILVNGSFESPVVAVLEAMAPDGWEVDPNHYGHTGYIIHGDYGSIWPSPHTGAQYFDVGNGSTYSLSQTFNIATAGAYQLNWVATAAVGVASCQYEVTIKNGPTTVASGSYDDGTGAVWSPRSLPMSLGTGAYTLAFTWVNGGGDLLVDTVSLAAVPEPSSCLLVSALGLGVLAVSRRIRRR